MLAQRAQWHHGRCCTAPRVRAARLGLHLRRSLLCRQPAAGLACGQCDACHLFLTGGHPDFRLVKRGVRLRKDNTGELRLRDEIVIDQVRSSSTGSVA
jgi:DNA polymerase-3 subunit delta'